MSVACDEWLLTPGSPSAHIWNIQDMSPSPLWSLYLYVSLAPLLFLFYFYLNKEGLWKQAHFYNNALIAVQK